VTLTSRVPAVIDYLVTTFTAATTLGAAASPVSVYDGPVVTETPAQLTLWVGMDDPDSEEAPVGAESESQWAALGAMARDEEISVHCVAEAWSGDTDVKATRLAAYGIVAAVETLLRADASLGGVLPSGWCEVTRMQLRQNNVPQGAVARVAFQVVCRARI
jgi:hypothetical protein